jgi:hypothetical protein
MAIAISIVGKYDGKDIAKAQRELDQMAKSAGIATKSAGDVGNGFKSMAGKLAIGALAIGGVAAGFTSLIRAAEESAVVQATTEQIIKSTGGAAKVTAEQVSELSRRLSEQMGVDDELIQKSTNLLLTFKNVKNEGEGLSAILDRATVASQDLAAAGFGDAESAAKMLGKALNDPTKGLTALSRAGVTFTQGQKDQVAALVASNNMFEAQNLIMAEVESQVGGVATATATATGRLSVMMGNMQEDLGAALLPFLSALADGLGPALQELTPAFSTIAGVIGGIFTTAVKVLLPPLTAVVTVLANVTAALLGFKPVAILATAVLGAWTLGLIANRAAVITASISNVGFAATFPILTTVTGIATTAMVGFRIAVSAALGPIGLIIIAITAATVLLPKLFGGITEVNEAYATMKDSAGNAAVAVGQAGAVASNVASVLGVHKKAVQESTTSTEELARSTAYAEQLYAVYAQKAEIAADRTEQIAAQADAAAKALDKSASSALSAAEAYALFSVTGYSPDPTRDERNAQARASAMMNASIEAINAARSRLKSAGGGAASAVNDGMKDQVSKFRELGTSITEHISSGLQRSEMQVSTALDTLITNVLAKAKRTAADPAFVDVMSSVADSISKNISDALTTAADALEKAQTEAKSWAANMATTLASAFDISGTFKAAIGEDGKLVVSKWQDGVNTAFAQFEWYTNVLRQIKESGGGDALMQYLVSQGVEQGGAQGQAMLDQGLIPYFNQKLEAVKTLSETTAQAMVPAFLQSGIDSAQKTYDGLKAAVGKGGPVFNAIQNLMDNLARSMDRTATVTVTTVNRVVTELVKAATLPGRANGGPVAANTAYLVGERGPEVFLPSASGQIVPNVDLGTSVSRSGVMAGSDGNTYNISVNAGVGDPRAIGQQIVEYIKRFESSNGNVFAAA